MDEEIKEMIDMLWPVKWISKEGFEKLYPQKEKSQTCDSAPWDPEVFATVEERKVKPLVININGPRTGKGEDI